MTTELETVVTTQAELDAALAASPTGRIIVDSPSGEWLTLWGSSCVEARDSSRVVARDSSCVVARDSSCVVARDSSCVVARDFSRVEASGSSCVVARDSSCVVARDSSRVEVSGSSRVEARDSSRVEASGSSRVEARDFSRVEASGSSRVVVSGFSSVEASGFSSVEAWGSSRVVARDSSRVEARGSSSVHAYGRSSSKAGPQVAVWLHQATAMVDGGQLIDLTKLDLTNPAVWCAHHGVPVVAGKATLYKATGPDLVSGRGYGKPTTWTVGNTMVCDDWRPDHSCGGGLHLSPHPVQARSYLDSDRASARYLRVEVDVASLWPIADRDPKCKVRAAEVIAEVDVHGDPLAANVDTPKTAD